MVSRLTFLVITIFFVTMNFLLWRSEFGGRNELPSSVPPEKVWEKILTAPDSSTLNIYYKGKSIGDCRWAPNVAQNRANSTIDPDEFEPEGMIKSPSSYDLEFDGSVRIPSLTNTARFNVSLRLTTNQVWQDAFVHVSLRPNTWEARVSSVSETLQLLVEDDNGQWKETYKFADLQKPEFLMNELGGPMSLMLLAALGPNAGGKTNALSALTLGLKWEAHNDWMRFGHSKVRVYKLEAKILDRYKVFIFVSRVGEILWVHLPNDVVLSSEAFTHF